MGHKVSTINDEPRQIRTLAALAIVIVFQYATASTTQCAFSTPSLPIQQNTPSSLFATASIASAIIASVPPPGSKLYHLRHLQSRSSTRRSSSISSSNGRNRGRTDLRYATRVDSSSSCSSSSHDDDTREHLPLQPRATELPHNLAHGATNAANNTSHESPPPTKRKRRHMLKSLHQFSRLNHKRHSQTTQPTNSTDYQLRKSAWAAKYTSLTTLRSTFGRNKNRFWGDFDPATTRKLYHTLIPRALLALHDMGLSDVDELAPLAYQARMAAKKYARERSRLPGRIGSMVYDGWRQWRRYGKWKFDGMTWEQIWDKYERQVLRETIGERLDEDESDVDDMGMMRNLPLEELNDEDLTAKICLRILERSVVTNGMIDKLFLRRLYGTDDGDDEEENEDDSVDATPSSKKLKRQEKRRQRTQQIQADLKAIEKKFDDDIRELLRHSSLTTEEGDARRRNRSTGSFFWTKDESTSPVSEAADHFSTDTVCSTTRGGGTEEVVDDAIGTSSLPDFSSESKHSHSSSDRKLNEKTAGRKLPVHEVAALRILASTRRRIATLQMGSENDSS